MKYNKIFRTLGMAIIFSLLIVALPTVPTYAITDYESIEVWPSEGEIGDRIYVDGYDFEREDTVYIHFSNDSISVGYDINDLDAYELVRTATSDIDGYLETYFTVPDELTEGAEQDVRGGNYYVYASYVRSGEIVAKATFTVIGGEITINPRKGVVGTEVEITGEDFGDRKSITVEYNGVEIDIASGDKVTNSNGDFTCTIIIPESANGDYTITVTDASYTEAEAKFTVEPQITISPTSGSIGDEITVSGTGFGNRKSITIYFNNVTITITSGTATTNTSGSFENVKFNVPTAGQGTYYVKAQDAAANVATAKFAIVATASFSLTEGYVGTEVTVSGAGFIANEEVTIYFAGTKVTTNPASVITDNKGSFSGSFLVPPSASGTYKVEVSDGTNKDSIDFTVLTSASLDQTTGNVGTRLTVSGIGFTGTVSIKYDEAEVTTVVPDSRGAFAVVFNAPPSSGGNHIITVSDGVTTEKFTFTMESTPPPIPPPLLPTMDSKAEAEAYFDWGDVTDPSGVTYTLQIASDPDFTSIVLEKKGLTESEYTLTEAEKLESTDKEAPYYWRVRAVDNAANNSKWTGAGSFYVGFSFNLPQWAIYALIGIGAVLVFIFGFWLGRRSAYYSSYSYKDTW